MYSLTNKFDLELYQLKLKTAFLNGTLEKSVFMEIPDGVNGTHVCILRKALYGLKVSPRRWYKRFKEVMLQLDFEIYPFQASMLIWKEINRLVLVLIYVDNILIISNCTKMTGRLKEH